MTSSSRRGPREPQRVGPGVERHLDERGGGQDGHALDPVIGEIRGRLAVEPGLVRGLRGGQAAREERVTAAGRGRDLAGRQACRRRTDASRVRLALPGRRRQRDPAPLAGIERGPAHVVAALPEPAGERRAWRRPPAGRAGARPGRRPAWPWASRVLAMAPPSTGCGPSSTKRRVPDAGQRADRGGEADRLAEVAAPVLGREVSGQSPARPVTVDTIGNATAAMDGGRRAPRRAARAADPSGGCGTRSSRRATGRPRLDARGRRRRSRARRRRRPGPSWSGALTAATADPVARGGDGAQRLGLGQLHRDHPPQALRTLHETRAVDDDAHRVGERRARPPRGRRRSRRRCGRSPRRARRPTTSAARRAPTWIAKIAGWAISVRSSRRSSSPARSRSSTDQPASARTSSSQASITRRNTGSRSSSSRPMPGHCAPCPEKTKASAGGARSPPARRRRRSAASASRASSSSRERADHGQRGADGGRGAARRRRRDRRGRASSARLLRAAPGTRAPARGGRRRSRAESGSRCERRRRRSADGRDAAAPPRARRARWCRRSRTR